MKNTALDLMLGAWLSRRSLGSFLLLLVQRARHKHSYVLKRLTIYNQQWSNNTLLAKIFQDSEKVFRLMPQLISCSHSVFSPPASSEAWCYEGHTWVLPAAPRPSMLEPLRTCSCTLTALNRATGAAITCRVKEVIFMHHS